ncbi:MAG: phage integrase family protein [Burkholderia sp.]
MRARLTSTHFALYRAWLEGVDEATLHRIYGTAGTGLATTRQLVTTIRDTLAIAARRAGDTTAAHLLRLKPGRIPAEAHAGAGEGVASTAPTLDAYRDAIDPDGVYSEAALLELYLEAYPPAASAPVDRKVSRNLRLRERQAQALARMQTALVVDPQPGDPLEDWFGPELVARFRAAGLVTLGDLLTLIRRRRQRWYIAIPKFGPRRAQRILDWLDLHAVSLGELSPLAMTPRRQLVPGHPALTRPVAMTGDIAPLEALVVPAELNGANGLNRAPVPAHQAALNTDLDAIHAWIAVRGARSVHTTRAYRREAERLLLWAIVVKHKPLSSLNTMDCAEYVGAFLADPQPAERWVGPARAERFDVAWRPFAGPLSDRSRETARIILASMCAWLVREEYLRVNPFSGLPSVDAARAAIDAAGRTSTHAQWQCLLQTVTRTTYTPAEHRDWFVVLFAYATGLRRAELAAATTGGLTRKALDGVLDDAWLLQVEGKGRRRRSVPVPARLMADLRNSLQLRPVPVVLEAAPPGTPLIAHLRTGEALTADAISWIFEQIFARAADHLERVYPGAAADLRRASTHWLRHTYANHALDAGTDIRDLQTTLGHASLGTTTLYTKTDDARRYASATRMLDAAMDGGRAASS